MTSKVSAATSLTPDQLGIINLIRKSGKDALTVREIEKSRYGNTPWFKAWLQKTQPKKDKLVTADDVNFAEVELPSEQPRNITDAIISAADPVTLDWNDDNSILPNNKIFALAVPERKVETLFAPFGPSAIGFLKDYNSKARASGHPTVPGKIIVAWVRYSPLEDGTLWVHEVQTDMFWAVGARHIKQRDVQEAMSRGGPMSKEANYYIRDVIKQRHDDMDRQMNLLEFDVLKEFVAAHFEQARIIFPTMKYRNENYPADMFGDKAAPASVYNELPRKMRFEKKDTKSLGLEDVPEGEVWVYASTALVTANRDIRQKELSHLLSSGSFGVVSAHRARAKSINKKVHGFLTSVAQKMQLDWYDVIGKWKDEYGKWNKEKSVLISGLTFDEAILIGKLLEQDAVIHKAEDGLVCMYSLGDKTVCAGLAVDTRMSQAMDLYSKTKNWSFEFVWGVVGAPWDGSQMTLRAYEKLLAVKP